MHTFTLTISLKEMADFIRLRDALSDVSRDLAREASNAYCSATKRIEHYKAWIDMLDEADAVAETGRTFANASTAVHSFIATHTGTEEKPENSEGSAIVTVAGVDFYGASKAKLADYFELTFPPIDPKECPF